MARQVNELDTIALEELLPEIPLWVKRPDYDRVCIFFQFLFLFFVAFRFSRLINVLCYMHQYEGRLVKQAHSSYVALS